MKQRQPKGKGKQRYSCRLHPDAIAAWKAAGGKQISTDLAAAFEAQWMPKGKSAKSWLDV